MALTSPRLLAALAAGLLTGVTLACSPPGTPTDAAAPPLPSAPAPSASTGPGAPASALASAPASAPASADPAPPPAASAAPLLAAPAVYPAGARHSPLTAGVVQNIHTILARGSGRRDVFAKVGDSITISGAFAACLVGDDVRWGEHAGLRETRDFFAQTSADGARSSFTRATEAARVGWRTGRVVESKGARSALQREVDAIRPAWAVVMLGTNDTYPDAMQGYARSLREVIEALTRQGVVPLLSTIPPRRDKQEARAQTIEMNAVVRAVAQAHQLPLMDLFGALDPLPQAGLNRDGVHPDPYKDDRYHSCWFDAPGLRAGMNQRNLLVLEALDRARRKVIVGEAPDADPPAVPGAGTWEAPFEVGALPAVFVGDTRSGPMRAGRYEGCKGGELAGPERVYRVTVEQARRLRVRLFVEGDTDASLRWLSSPDPAACVASARSRLDVTVKPGTYWLAVDAPTASRAGGYELTLLSP